MVTVLVYNRNTDEVFTTNDNYCNDRIAKYVNYYSTKAATVSFLSVPTHLRLSVNRLETICLDFMSRVIVSTDKGELDSMIVNTTRVTEMHVTKCSFIDFDNNRTKLYTTPEHFIHSNDPTEVLIKKDVYNIRTTTSSRRCIYTAIKHICSKLQYRKQTHYRSFHCSGLLIINVQSRL
jgi:hypothetical protein